MKVHKKNHSWMGGMATMLLCTLLFSCNNEELLDHEMPKTAGNSIAFGLSSGNHAQTRSHTDRAENGYTANRFVLRSDNSADTLCARVVVSDGIYLSGFEESPALTRAAPVTTDNFYDKFHVVAYWKKNGTPVTDRFFLDEDATQNSSNIWNTDKIYYWPGAEHTFQFYAWAPTNAAGLTAPTSPQSKQMTYTVSANVAAQKDIVVATTAEVPGNNNAAVPLSFRHICTAVRFTVGEIQAGTIKKVTLKGVFNAGTYDMAAASWALAETTADFSQTLNKVMDGTEAAGSAITTAEGTFMMLPQTLPAGAKVEVLFSPTAGGERTLTATIGGTAWTMGTTVTYRITITPEYELEFVSQPQVQDAHYVIIPIKIEAKDLNNVNYTLVSSNSTICKLREKLIGPEEQGYWPKETAGNGDFVRKESVSSNVEGETVYYAFLTENATPADRQVTFELQYNNQTVRTMTITQKCPNWIGDMGWEKIEEDGLKPFGFAWTRKVTYVPNDVWARLVISVLRFLGIIQSNPAISYEFSIWGTVTSCTIDYSKVEALSNVYSETDGLTNTKSFSTNSASALTSVENTLGRWCSITSESGENINSTDFAALVCLKKNACEVEKTTTTNGDVVYLPSFKDADINWYLPASGQFTISAGLIGQYWSSTAINDNENAYSWNSSVISTPRMELHKVRAVRKSGP